MEYLSEIRKPIRHCKGKCGTILNSYNKDKYCSPCLMKMIWGKDGKVSLDEQREDKKRKSRLKSYYLRKKDGDIIPSTKESRRRLTPAQVRKIRKLSAQGEMANSLSKEFNVSAGAIYYILAGKTYQDVI